MQGNYIHNSLKIFRMWCFATSKKMKRCVLVLLVFFIQINKLIIRKEKKKEENENENENENQPKHAPTRLKKIEKHNA